MRQSSSNPSGESSGSLNSNKSALRSSYQSISQNLNEQMKKRNMGKKNDNVSTGITHQHHDVHGLSSRGVITDSTRDPCREISTCRNRSRPILQVSCCSMLQINEKCYFTYWRKLTYSMLLWDHQTENKWEFDTVRNETSITARAYHDKSRRSKKSSIPESESILRRS